MIMENGTTTHTARRTLGIGNPTNVNTLLFNQESLGCISKKKSKTHNKTQHNIFQINQTYFFTWFLHVNLDFFVGHESNQTFSNILEISNQ